MRGELRNGNAIELLFEDVVCPLLKIGYLRFKTLQEALRDLAQEHAALAGRIEKRRILGERRVALMLH